MRRSEGPLTRCEAELIGAALRYTAVADWFESRPITRAARDGEAEAMAAFNRIEAELRQAGRQVLRHLEHRELVLRQALDGVATT
ncbi:MAG: hypothetical protein PVJ57_17570 [Phycisphaerae bacterium]|jgi:hypothetical protein